MPSVLMVIAPDQFRDEEYAEPREVLVERGADVSTASLAPGPCRGKLGMMARADFALADVDPSGFDAVVFVGGGGSKVFFDDVRAHHIARELHGAGKVVGAICIAPSILARAGLLEGRDVTSFPSQETDLEAYGARFTDSPVEVDGTIVTANGPEAARAFGEALAEALHL
jgi:protease I